MAAMMEQIVIKVFFHIWYLDFKTFFYKANCIFSTTFLIQLAFSKMYTNAVSLTVGGTVGTIVVIIIGAVIAVFVLR